VQDFDPAVATALVGAVVQARRDGLPPPEGEVLVELDEPGYRCETPRRAAGSVIRTFDRDVVVTLRIAQPAPAGPSNVPARACSPVRRRRRSSRGSSAAWLSR
jgi:hypothetical protein